MAQLHILRKNLIYEAKFIFLGRPLSFDFEIYKSTDIYIYDIQNCKNLLNFLTKYLGKLTK